MTRFIFITGGVVSSLGKGIASAGLGALLQAKGYKVRLRKLDPYLNVDPGTMSPYQHGEVFVTDDGAETDLDLGHYERFTGVNATKLDNITSGKLYSNIIAKERAGDYLGSTVQMIPHLTNEIKDFIKNKTEEDDFVLCEIGGTVGDIESLPYIEAIRQFANDHGHENTLFLHLTLAPYISASGELKTKPTQHSVKELLSFGIQPNILLVRSEKEITEHQRKKIGLFCNINPARVIPAYDVKSIYEIPFEYQKHGLTSQVLKHFNLESKHVDMSKWDNIAGRAINPKNGEITIAIVGKYIELPDAYKSIIQALQHSGIHNDVKVCIRWVQAGESNEEILKQIKDADGIIIPGGYGERGMNGKLCAITFSRQNNVPLLGICLGMQMSIIEFSRNVLGLTEATSSEFDPKAKVPVIGLMTQWQKDGITEERSENEDLGGTMRLGAYDCNITKNTLAHKIYAQETISERHRHRYEVNINYIDQLAEKGLIMSGSSPDGRLPEIIENINHPWFIAVQYHPELKSRPFNPHPLFVSLIEAAMKKQNNTL